MIKKMHFKGSSSKILRSTAILRRLALHDAKRTIRCYIKVGERRGKMQ